MVSYSFDIWKMLAGVAFFLVAMNLMESALRCGLRTAVIFVRCSLLFGFLVYFMDSKSSAPTQVINNRQDLFPVFDNLNTYVATMHFNGQSTIKLDGDRASSVTYCRAYHLNSRRRAEAYDCRHLLL